jgi:hypothetical protein
VVNLRLGTRSSAPSVSLSAIVSDGSACAILLTRELGARSRQSCSRRRSFFTRRKVFFEAVRRQADEVRLLFDEHFTVDGTRLEAWANHKSFPPRDAEPPPPAGGNPSVNFRAERRPNDTHQSTTYPDARLYKKTRGSPTRLAYLGHVLMEHRSVLIVRTAVTRATGHGKRTPPWPWWRASPAGIGLPSPRIAHMPATGGAGAPADGRDTAAMIGAPCLGQALALSLACPTLSIA